jgi:hypothetical protein
MHNRFIGDAKMAAAARSVAFGLLHNVAVGFAGHHTALDASHLSFLLDKGNDNLV